MCIRDRGELSINSAYDIAKAPPTLKKETNPDPMFTTPAQEIGESKPAAAQPEKNSESARTKSISPQKKAQPEPDTAKAEPVPPSIPSPDPVSYTHLASAFMVPAPSITPSETARSIFRINQSVSAPAGSYLFSLAINGPWGASVKAILPSRAVSYTHLTHQLYNIPTDC